MEEPHTQEEKAETPPLSDKEEEVGGAPASAGPGEEEQESKAEADASASEAGQEPRPGGGGTAVIVPYRDLHPEQQRAAHLEEFVRRMPEVLKGHNFKLFIIEQSDDGRKFNRGKLLNIGFDLAAKEGFETFVFHDVDLIPSPDLVPHYTQRPEKPVHIARVWARYSGNPKYIGGAVAFSAEDFRKINGFPNTFWGWGGEDDEMYKRMTEVGLSMTWPESGSMEDLERQSLEEKLQVLRKNREWKCNVKWEVLNEHDKTWQTNGLADLSYEVLGREELGEHATKITVDVKLNDHWSDTVFDAPPQQGGGSQHRRHHHRPREEYRRGDRDGDRDREYRRGDRDGGREREYRREDRDGDGERDGKRPRRDDDRPRHR